MSDWQTIDTAPKDGTLILLLSAEYTVEADEWSPEIHHSPQVALGMWNPDGTSWVDKYGLLGGDCHRLEVTGFWSSEGGWFQPNEVTHWSPIPALPTPRDDQED